MEERLYYVYILASRRNGTLYIGVTNDLPRRVWEHKQGLVRGFTKKYGIGMLVYYEVFGDIDAAIARETRLKKYKRAWKIHLIQQANIEWRDLAENWFEVQAIPPGWPACAGHDSESLAK